MRYSSVMDPASRPAPPSPVPAESPVAPARAPGTLDRSHVFALLALVAVWGGTAWGTHFLFGAGWGWCFLLGPVLLVMGYLYLVGTMKGPVEGGKEVASIFERSSRKK
jgi:hypothetical protein